MGRLSNQEIDKAFNEVVGGDVDPQQQKKTGQIGGQGIIDDREGHDHNLTACHDSHYDD